MSTVLIVFLVLAMGATVGALVWGLIAMARGGEFNAKWSNTMMQYRILFQFIAVIVFVGILLLVGKG